MCQFVIEVILADFSVHTLVTHCLFFSDFLKGKNSIQLCYSTLGIVIRLLHDVSFLKTFQSPLHNHTHKFYYVYKTKSSFILSNIFTQRYVYFDNIYFQSTTIIADYYEFLKIEMKIYVTSISMSNLLSLISNKVKNNSKSFSVLFQSSSEKKSIFFTEKIDSCYPRAINI